MSNTIDYQQEWAAVVQERLSDPALWNIINNVKVVDGDVYNNPYETHASFQSHTKGTAYTHQDVTFTNETAIVDQSVILPQQIDRVDLIQSKYANLMKLAEMQGVSAGEKLDNLMLAAHAGWENFDNASIGGAAGNITVSINNIDDIIDNLDVQIDQAKGNKLANRNGRFIVWRAADFAKLKGLARSQGFLSADDIIMNGMNFGFKYGGWEHYVSSQHTSGHLFAGVKKVHFLGVAAGAFPMVYTVDEPTLRDTASDVAGNLSAKSVVTRIDHVYKTFNNFASVLFDVLVA